MVGWGGMFKYKGEPLKPAGDPVEYFFKRNLKWTETVSDTHLLSYKQWEKKDKLHGTGGEYDAIRQSWSTTPECSDLCNQLLLACGNQGKGDVDPLEADVQDETEALEL